MEGVIRVSIVATGIDVSDITSPKPLETPAVISIDNSVYQQNTSRLDSEVLEDNNKTLEDEVYAESIANNINNETDYVIEERIKENASNLDEVYSEKETLNSYICKTK